MIINILDNNALIELEKSGSYVTKYNSCFITEEIKQEFLIGRKEDDFLSKCNFISIDVDFPFYLKEYKRVLNIYNLMSFFNLKGIGDMSILATVCAKSKEPNKTMEMFPDVINVVTNDNDLTKAVNKEFPDQKSVTVQKTVDWIKTI
jgi:hypothetical protein